MKLRFTIYFGLLCTLLCSAAYAQVVTDPATGRSYEYVSFAAGEPTTWEAARDAAALRQFAGQNGHLVTITSAEENAFIVDQLSADVPFLERLAWIGAFESDNAGIWTWAVGPEAGQPFWDENTDMATSPFNYANWAEDEPNDGIPPEQWAFTALSEELPEFLGQWIDDQSSSGNATGYIVEYPPLPESQPVPVNSPLWLLALIAAMLILGLFKARLN